MVRAKKPHAPRTLPPRSFVPAPPKSPGSGDLRPRFIPLATKYMFDILKTFGYLEGLSNKRYHHKDEEWEKMRKTLQDELNRLDFCFKNRTGHKAVQFSFETEE